MSSTEATARALYEAEQEIASESGESVGPAWRALTVAHRRIRRRALARLVNLERIRIRTETGPIEQTVRTACEQRESEPLVRIAFELAYQLDQGVDDKALAGMARELRITLDALGVALGAKREETSVADELRAKRAAREAAAASEQHPAVRDH